MNKNLVKLERIKFSNIKNEYLIKKTNYELMNGGVKNLIEDLVTILNLASGFPLHDGEIHFGVKINRFGELETGEA